MNRRTAFKTLALATGALITLPPWMLSCGMTDKKTHLSSFSPEQQHTLAIVADTIIPAGNAIGALSVGVDKYLQKLFDDCYEKEICDNIKSKLDKLQSHTEKPYGSRFSNASQNIREQALLDFLISEDTKEIAALIKTETIRGFSTSREVMVDYHGYKVAPGHFYGSVKVNS